MHHTAMQSRIMGATPYWELSAKCEDDVFSHVVSHHCNSPDN